MSDEKHARLARVTSWTGHSAPLLSAVVAAGALGALFSDRFNRPVTYAVVAILAAVIGVADYMLRNRLAKKQAAAVERFERTPPALVFEDAKLRDGKTLWVALRSSNGVPFMCRWTCVTVGNTIVVGNTPNGASIMTEDVPVYPEALPEKVVVFNENVQVGRLVDGFLELRFRYHSLFGPKYGNPKNLGRQTLHVAWRVDGETLTRVDASPTEIAVAS